MKIPQTTHPELQAIGEGLQRSLQQHVVANGDVQQALHNLAFELEFAIWDHAN